MSMFTVGRVDWLQVSIVEEANKSASELHKDAEWEVAWDDVTGEALRPDSVRQVRLEELEYPREMKAYAKVPIDECTCHG